MALIYQLRKQMFPKLRNIVHHRDRTIRRKINSNEKEHIVFFDFLTASVEADDYVEEMLSFYIIIGLHIWIRSNIWLLRRLKVICLFILIFLIRLRYLKCLVVLIHNSRNDFDRKTIYNRNFVQILVSENL